MPVGHQRGALGAAGDVLELRERVRLVLAEDTMIVDSWPVSSLALTPGPTARVRFFSSADVDPHDVAALVVHVDATSTNSRMTSMFVSAWRDSASVRNAPPPPSAMHRQQLIGQVTPDRHARRQ